MAGSKFRAGDRERAKDMFRKLPRSVRKATSVALDGAATELSDAIRRRVPEDQGGLKDSVRWDRGASKDAKKAAGADPDLTVRVIEGDRKAFYASMVEFGTTRTPAQPHFYPTYRSLRKRLSGRIKRAQRKAIKEAAQDV
jgi:HK97 gp10 family phage protein